jgi:hypothetical protein
MRKYPADRDEFDRPEGKVVPLPLVMGGFLDAAAVQAPSDLTATEFSPWTEAVCQQMCGWDGSPARPAMGARGEHAQRGTGHRPR